MLKSGKEKCLVTLMGVSMDEYTRVSEQKKKKTEKKEAIT